MAETNFVPNLGEFIELTSGPVPLFRGVGAPSITPPEGSIYIDTSTGDIYEFTNNSWTLVSNGGGGGGGDADWSAVSGAYGANNQPPALTTARGIGYNTDDQSVHYWFSGSWH